MKVNGDGGRKRERKKPRAKFAIGKIEPSVPLPSLAHSSHSLSLTPLCAYLCDVTSYLHARDSLFSLSSFRFSPFYSSPTPSSSLKRRARKMNDRVTRVHARSPLPLFRLFFFPIARVFPFVKRASATFLRRRVVRAQYSVGASFLCSASAPRFFVRGT